DPPAAGSRPARARVRAREDRGAPRPTPPLIEALAYDPVLRDCKLIAEAWDAGGLYHVGSFPNYHRWSEWNGKYRDTLRRFLNGDQAVDVELAHPILGPPDPFRHPRPLRCTTSLP